MGIFGRTAPIAAVMIALHSAGPVPAKAASAYVIAEAEILDQAGYQPYLDRSGKLIEAFGGRFLIRGGKTTSVAGAPPKRISMYVFESPEKAQAFFDSAEYKELIPIRDKFAQWRGYIVEGAAP